MQKIVPHLWFDKEAGEASEFYMKLFADSKLVDKTVLDDTPSGTAEMFTIELAGQEFILLSAGPYFKFTPAVSFVIACNSEEETESFWERLIENGMALMPFDTYPFSKKYGWLIDRYGLSWQIMYVGDAKINQKITPSLMFVGEQCGKAEEAAAFYTSVFENSAIRNINRCKEEVPSNKAGSAQLNTGNALIAGNAQLIEGNAQTIAGNALIAYTLDNQEFTAMDSAYEHGFTFNEAISFLVNCDNQEEIDYYWSKLSFDPEAEQCGWLKDRYGLSWQIVPTILNDMMQEKNPEKMAKVTEAFLRMKKFDIAELKKAYEQ